MQVDSLARLNIYLLVEWDLPAFPEPTVDPEALAKIPPIVDLDAHAVEPPDLWSSRLPAKYREVGPRIVIAPAGNAVQNTSPFKNGNAMSGAPIFSGIR